MRLRSSLDSAGAGKVFPPRHFSTKSLGLFDKSRALLAQHRLLTMVRGNRSAPREIGRVMSGCTVQDGFVPRTLQNWRYTKSLECDAARKKAM
jgi:hypothetical protein